MRILTDECVYRLTTETLRKDGHEVVTAQEAMLAGKEDQVVLDAAARGGYVFMTNDMHFSNILAFPPAQFHGIVVLKIRPRNQDKVHSALLKFLGGKSQVDLDRMLVIVDQSKYRIRRG